MVRNKERSLRLLDVMPRLPLGMPTYFFRYPDVQYKKVAYRFFSFSDSAKFNKLLDIAMRLHIPMYYKKAHQSNA